jgi:hypothetical protein
MYMNVFVFICVCACLQLCTSFVFQPVATSRAVNLFATAAKKASPAAEKQVNISTIVKVYTWPPNHNKLQCFGY